MQTVVLPLSLLVEGNQIFKPHDEKTLEGLTESIKKWGLFHEILVVRRNDGFYEVVSGFGRLKAARDAGLKEIACKIIEDWQLPGAMFDTDLFRRHLTPVEVHEGMMARDQAEKTGAKLIAEFNSIRQYLPHTVLRALVQLSEKEQEQLLKAIPEKVQPDPQMQKEFERKIASLEEALRRKQSVVDDLLKKLADIQKEKEKLEASVSVRKVDLEKLKEEIEKKVRQEYEEPLLVQKAREEEREKVYSELKEEIEEKTKKIREVSQKYQELQTQIETLREELKKAQHDKEEAEKGRNTAWSNMEYFREALHKVISSDLLTLDLKSLSSEVVNIKQRLLSIKDKIIRIGMENLKEQKDAIMAFCKSLCGEIQRLEEIRKEIEMIVVAASKPGKDVQTSE
jgi:ParB-like chromosome segregation protein Spo0J